MSGKVLDQQTHQPVPYASVVVAGTTQGTGRVLSFGRTIARQAYSIQSITGNRAESVVISRQAVAHSALVLPFTAGALGCKRAGPPGPDAGSLGCYGKNRR